MSLSELIACAGTWQGVNTLQDPHTNTPMDSPATATAVPILNNTFVRFDYTWSYQNKPQEGSILFGFDKKANSITAHWIDSWHMGSKVMECSGPVQDGMLSVRGSYAAPPGPDWGWRIDLQSVDDGTLKMVMYNVWPEGREDLAVEALYSRV